MRVDARVLQVITFLAGYALALDGTRARAQDPGLGAMLGGYGAMAGAAGSSMGGGYLVVAPAGSGGNVIVPYAGKLGASLAAGTGGGTGISFTSRSSSPMSSARPSFVLDSMSGMSPTAGGMGGRRPFALRPSALTGGMGPGGEMRRMPATGGMGVMPPRIGSPFRQPPSLLTSPAVGGMSM
jgi:hypothetical protein